MTRRSEFPPRPDCAHCKGSGIIAVSKDPDEVADCVCTDPPRTKCPECRDGKHGNCIHEALTDDTDEFVDCVCGCEPSRTCPSCGDVVPFGWTLDDHLNCNYPEERDV